MIALKKTTFHFLNMINIIFAEDDQLLCKNIVIMKQSKIILCFLLFLNSSLFSQKNNFEFYLTTGIKVHNPFNKYDYVDNSFQKPKGLFSYVATSPIIGTEVIYKKKYSIEYRKSIWARAAVNSILGNIYRLTTNDLFLVNKYFNTHNKSNT